MLMAVVALMCIGLEAFGKVEAGESGGNTASAGSTGAG